MEFSCCLELQGYTQLMHAISHENVTLVEKICQENPEQIMKQSTNYSVITTAFDAAIYHCHPGIREKILEILLKNGANPNEKIDAHNMTIFLSVMLAYRTGRYDDSESLDKTIKLLLQYKADPNTESERDTPLSLACKMGNEYLVKMLLEYGADVTMTVGHNSESILMSVSGESSSAVKIMELLIQHGADPNLKDKDNVSPLMIAAYKSKKMGEVPAKFLLDNKANVNSQDNNGISALVVACCKNAASTVKLLLEYNANPNFQDINGDTALMKILTKTKENKNALQIAKNLLENGADVKLQNNQGQTAFEIAMANKSDVSMEIICLLMDKDENAIMTDPQLVMMQYIVRKELDKMRDDLLKSLSK